MSEAEKQAESELEKQAAGFEQLAEDRRRTTDQMVWQVPGLSVAAQAFLYTRALEPNTSATARLLVAIVGLCTALATMQLLLKHRYHEETYSLAIDASRRDRGLDPLQGMGLFKDRASELNELNYRRWTERHWLARVVRESSVRIWIWTLGVFAAVDGFVIFVAVLGLLNVWNPLS